MSDDLSFGNSYQKTIHQVYLQLREDVLSGQLYCHEEASFSLGGLALQAETGDYNGTLVDEYFLPEHYIPSRVCNMLKLLILIITTFRGPSTCLKGVIYSKLLPGFYDLCCTCMHRRAISSLFFLTLIQLGFMAPYFYQVLYISTDIYIKILVMQNCF